MKSVVPYLPIGTALIALLGVFITLRYGDRKERKASLIARHDEARKDGRAAVASLSSAANTYIGHADRFRRSAGWAGIPPEDLKQNLADFSQAKRDLNEQIIIAMLICVDARLQVQLGHIQKICAIINQGCSNVGAAVRDDMKPDLFPAEAHAARAVKEFTRSMGEMHKVALMVLRPTVLDREFTYLPAGMIVEKELFEAEEMQNRNESQLASMSDESQSDRRP